MKIAKAEPPAPQTQRMVAPAADPELKWGAFDGRPSMPLACGVAAPAGEEDQRAELEKEWMAQSEWLDFTNWLIEVKLRHVPAITDERIDKIAAEYADMPQMSVEESIIAAINLALKESGVRK